MRALGKTTLSGTRSRSILTQPVGKDRMRITTGASSARCRYPKTRYSLFDFLHEVGHIVHPKGHGHHRAVEEFYRQKSREVHPDCGGSHEAFIELQRAYEQAMELCGASNGVLTQEQ
jgi:hypothetical protein